MRKVEGLGFSTLVVADHFGNGTVCTPRLAAAAAVSTTLRLGSYVYDNDFRHPVLVAREAAEIDVLSDGRMELGLGAGWAVDEYRMVGIPFDDGATRSRRYREAVGIIRALHGGEKVSHQGEFYRLDDCELFVEPVQRPIPLLLGGGGPAMTRFAARHADIVAFVPRSLPAGGLDPAESSADAFNDKIEVLNESLPVGVDPERGVQLFYVGTSKDGLPSDPASSWSSPDLLVGGPYSLIGDSAAMVDALQERRERWGLSYFTCWEENVELLAPVVSQLVGT